MKTSLALIVAATSVFVFTLAADAQYGLSADGVVLRPVARPTTAYYAPTTAYYAPTTAYYAPTTAYYPTSAYYAPTTAYYGGSGYYGVAITAATIAADCSALAWAAGPVFGESTEGGIVAGGKRRGCRCSRSS